MEIAFRTHITYLIAHKYGTLGYRNKENFLDETWHSEFINELEKTFTIRRKVNYSLSTIIKITRGSSRFGLR
ncbi:hypothetical protein [Oceanobacillus sp. Castelsardo]|uniref:hypothetical protein n=1 Tax=Oceanobacillus sp. Castelsardo TaxID=1851204 RepID=UPI0012E7B746